MLNLLYNNVVKLAELLSVYLLRDNNNIIIITYSLYYGGISFLLV